MSRKKAKKAKSQSKAHNKPQKRSGSKAFNWMKFSKLLTIFVVLSGLAAFSVSAYMDKLATEQDVSVIGNGKPTVVQIHDPGCQMCQQLKRNLDSVKGDFKDDIQFKTVNIKTKKGRDFAGRHSVDHVTLVLFNGRGKRVDTLVGITPKKDISTALERLAPK